MCGYCTNGYSDMLDLMDGKYNSAYIVDGKLDSTVEDLPSVKINYCPMCGRKFEIIKVDNYKYDI